MFPIAFCKIQSIFFLLFSNLCAIYVHLSYAEVFTAVAELECLIDTHKKIIDNLDPYVEMQEKKLLIMKGYLDVFSREHIRAMKDISTYLSNPVNTFILVKRLISDLNYFNLVLSKGSEYILNLLVDQETTVYPDRNDLIGAAEALGRLQKTYNLNVKDLADGNLNNIAYSSPMTVSDCYDLSQALLVEGNYLEAGRNWMVEAHRKYKQDNISYPFTEVDITKYIGYVDDILGRTENDFDYESEENETERISNEKESTLKRDVKQLTTDEMKEAELSYYEALCRGDFVLSEKVSSRLTCRYMTQRHPFTKLAPFKVEMMYLNPDIFLFHDVLSDYEIESIKQMGKPSLERATTVDDETDENVFVSYRISKLTWFYDEDSEIIARISQRVSDMSGLSIESAEPLQLCNYGIGGHYEPHFDFAMKFEKESSMDDERIATTLFYMSDVAQGGATVFPGLGLTLYPKKGAAAFWFNLHRSGAGDLATRHAACPVLQGDKWVSTKWIRQYDQEFLRPCRLKYQSKTYFNKRPHPVPKNFSKEHEY